LNGPLVVRRARYRCRKTGRFYFPLDEVLDLPGGEVTSPLAKRALRLATYMSLGELEEELQVQHKVRLSDSVLDRLMQAVGSVAERDRQEELDGLLAVSGVDREQAASAEPLGPRPKRLYISCDGAMYPTRYREERPDKQGRKLIYQEMKCGTVFWQERDGSWRKRVLSGRDSVERFGLSLWTLAVRCGMFEAREVIFISDAGSWCETIAKTYFRDAIRILDWYHLSEHVWDAGRALYPNERAAKHWVSHCLELLKASSGIGLLRYLQRSRRSRAGRRAGQMAKSTPAGLEELDNLIAYLRPRLAATDYVDYEAAGFCIGSGMMEATCKQLVCQRLKGSGRQWSERGALAMATLLTHRHNQAWDRLWNTRPLQRAA